MREVVIVASAFGVETIRRDGHAAWVGTAARAGAAAFEVRRELMHDADAEPAALAALGEAIAREGMWAVWSTPDSLYDTLGQLDEAALRDALASGRALGARFAKLQLGGFAGEAHAERLLAVLAEAQDGPRIVVENGQLKEGGSLAQFKALFAQPLPIGMTFDIGNWQWPGEAPLAAAEALAPYVEYIHCKAVTGEGARRFAVAPAADDTLCRAALALLPAAAPRGIEFPFDATRLAADAEHYVNWLATA